MNARQLPIPLLLAGAIVFACGPRTRSTEAAATPHHRASSRTPLTAAVDVRPGATTTFVLSVTNDGPKRIEVDFPSGQTYDFTVLDSAGATVWTWSEGRMFTQALRNKPLAQGESLTYEERWNATGRHGRHAVVARLASSNYPIEKRVEFVLP